MNKKRNPKIDWSKHIVKTIQSENFLKTSLTIPDREEENSVNFINTSGVLVVTGAYGNWIFSQEFQPSVEGCVDDGYWIQKLEDNSIQDPVVFSEEATRKKLLEMLREEIWECYGESIPNNIGEIEDCSTYDLEELLKGYHTPLIKEIEYLKGCLDELNVGSHRSYITYAADELPGSLDSESIVEKFGIHFQLLAVFDAFDEICQRMQKEK
jgi:hypothetical protein